MKVSGQWKELEKTVARKFGGVRLSRGADFSVSALDVETEHFCFDAKWRSSLATVTWFKKLRKDNKKIYDGKKVPVLVLKEKGMRGELVVLDIDDFIEVVNNPKYKIVSENVDTKEIEND